MSDNDTHNSPLSDRESTTATPVVVALHGLNVATVNKVFSEIPTDSGLAYVLIQTYGVNGAHPVAVPEPACRLPVRVVEDGVEVRPDTIHVIKPDARAIMRDSRLHLLPPALGGEEGEEFLLSLARDRAANCACVILPGVTGISVPGLRAIKQAGGLVIAQRDAIETDMLRSALEAGMIDLLLPADAIAANLQGYFSAATSVHFQGESDIVAVRIAGELRTILGLLRQSTGHDFGGYQPTMMLECVQRRMQVLQTTDVSTLLERLRDDPHEGSRLYRTLFRDATAFFRDLEAFEALQHKALPRLLAGKGPQDSIRVWVPGCSTGEEAYSLAMMLHAQLPGQGSALQIVGTDIDEWALAIARNARYPASFIAGIPPDYVARYCVQDEGSFRIAEEVRELCLFSAHDLMRDTPFPEQDLISCRNLLSHLTAPMQAHVTPLLHQALNQGGLLFLGASDQVTRHSQLFTTVDQTQRIYQRQGVAQPTSLFPTEASRRPSPLRLTRSSTAGLRLIAEKQLLDHFAPAYVIINADGDLLQSSRHTGKYLELPAGAPDTNLFSMTHSGLRLALRTALQAAVATGHAATQPGVSIGLVGQSQDVAIHVQPIRHGDPPKTLYIVVFQDIAAAPPRLITTVDSGAAAADLQQAETELRKTQERLRLVTGELEAANEKLTSSNEELSSMNEELRMTTTDLAAFKRELQAINEDLRSVNAELVLRVDGLRHDNDAIDDLLNSTKIAMVLLDRALRVTSFTAAATDIFRLTDSHTGLPITQVQPLVNTDALQDDLHRVLETRSAIERLVRSNEGDATYLMRLLPHRAPEHVPTGVVMTFIDVTWMSGQQVREKPGHA